MVPVQLTQVVACCSWQAWPVKHVGECCGAGKLAALSTGAHSHRAGSPLSIGDLQIEAVQPRANHSCGLQHAAQSLALLGFRGPERVQSQRPRLMQPERCKQEAASLLLAPVLNESQLL